MVKPSSMSEEPNANRKIGCRLVVRIAISALIACLIGLGTWKYWTRTYATPPPNALQTRRLVPRAAIRLDSAAAPQNPSQQPAPPQQYEGSPDRILDPDYDTKLACFAHPKTQVNQKLIAMLGADYLSLSQILKGDEPRQDPKIVRRLLDSLLEAAKSAPPEKKPPLLVSADAIAERLALPSIVPPSPELQRELDALAGQGLTFTWVELDGAWSYQNNLLWRVWRGYPTSEQGGAALLLLLPQSWGKSLCFQYVAAAF